MSDGAPESITSSRVRSIHDYWNRKRGSRRVASRTDIDPAEIKALLPYLMITELHYNPLRVRYRLLGTRIVDAAKIDLTGKWLHEVDLSGNNLIWIEVYRRVTETMAPVFGRTRATVGPGDVQLFDWVVLPLSDDAATVNHTLKLEDWEMLRPLSKEDVDSAEWTVEPLP